jgi:hypothetical protein
MLCCKVLIFLKLFLPSSSFSYDVFNVFGCTFGKYKLFVIEAPFVSM